MPKMIFISIRLACFFYSTVFVTCSLQSRRKHGGGGIKRGGCFPNPISGDKRVNCVSKFNGRGKELIKQSK